MLASVVSNFVTGGPAWGYEAQIRKFFKRNVWKVNNTSFLRALLSSMTDRRDAPSHTRSQPNPRTLTLAQLWTYSGANPNRPIYISIEGQVYDVSASRRIYGPGGSYNVMWILPPQPFLAARVLSLADLGGVDSKGGRRRVEVLHHRLLPASPHHARPSGHLCRRSQGESAPCASPLCCR